MLAAIGAGDLIYGVTPSVVESPFLMDRMPHAQSIGAGSAPDIEFIISLKPDVVLIPTTSGNSAQLAEKFSMANITYLNIDGFIITQIPEEIRILGNLSGHSDDAERYLRFYTQYKNIINSRLESVPLSNYPDVYIESNPELCTYGKGSGGDSLVRMAYGANIAGNLENYYPYVSQEWLMDKNPDIIIKIVSKNYYANTTITGAFQKLQSRTSVSGTNAVKNHRIYILNNEVTYDTRGIIAQLYLAKTFYPEKFWDINPDEVLREYSTEFLPWPEGEIPIYPCDWCIKKYGVSK
jgi:iron complex transport system substrate-binding protein